jgi:hypothetical protein
VISTAANDVNGDKPQSFAGPPTNLSPIWRDIHFDTIYFNEPPFDGFEEPKLKG